MKTLSARNIKVKVHRRTGHKGPLGEQRYSSTLPSTSELDGGGWSMACPGQFTPKERPGTGCIGGWVGPRASLDGCGKSRPYQDSMPGPSSPLRVAIPTELSLFFFFLRCVIPVVCQINAPYIRNIEARIFDIILTGAMAGIQKSKFPHSKTVWEFLIQ